MLWSLRHLSLDSIAGHIVLELGVELVDVACVPGDLLVENLLVSCGAVAVIHHVAPGVEIQQDCRILIKWITPYSKNTLDYLDISGNNLTKIPNEIRNYHNLTTFEVIFNQQPLTIQKNALNLKKITLNSYKKVYLSHVTSIQPGAFQGMPTIIN